jgi:hypothetical protein
MPLRAGEGAAHPHQIRAKMVEAYCFLIMYKFRYSCGECEKCGTEEP